MKKTFALLILLITTNILFAQKQKEYITPNKKYSSAKIYIKGNKILRVKSLQLINDSTIIFKNTDTPKVAELSLSQVKYFSVKKGSKALQYGLFGAGVGLLTVLLAVKDVETGTSYEYRDNLGLRIAIIIGGFGAIGAGIGALIPKWKRMYIKDKRSSFSLILYPSIQRNYYSLGLSFNF